MKRKELWLHASLWGNLANIMLKGKAGCKRRYCKTVDLEKGENTTIEISGRHDPCICPRVTAVAESVTAIVLADHMIRGGFIHPTNLNKSL